MTWQPTAEYPKRYGWKTPITAPGPKGNDMLRSMRKIQGDPLPYLEQVWRNHGDVVQFPIPWPVYLVSSPGGARDVLVNMNRDMGKRTLQYTTLSLVTGFGLLTADTAEWKPRRRAMQPAFHHQLVALTQSRVDEALFALNDEWRELTADGPAIVDIDQAMMELALKITGAALFGINLEDDAREITEATLIALHGVIARAQNPLPFPLAVPTPGNVRMNGAVKRLDRAVEKILDMRAKNMLPKGAPIRDMLDVLLDLDEPLTAQQLRDEIVTFIVAGHETVASALTWAWQLLGEQPELRDRVGADAEFAHRAFDETLRLYPPAWVITRRVLNDVEIDGCLIPAGAMVIVSPWLVHRHPEAWSQPMDFMPDRFEAGIPQLGYIPFGAGPRLCIGREMARMEGPSVLHNLSSNWIIEPVADGDVAIDASVTLRPKYGLPMRVSARSTND